MTTHSNFRPLHDALKANLVFVTGKGGTGKSAVARAIAKKFSTKERTLLVTFEDPTLPPNGITELSPGLFQLNVDAMTSFEEYVGMKLGLPSVAALFVGNKLIRYLAKAAPGLHEMVLLGKVWHERNHYSKIVADMPSSGYTVTMFQSTQNFAKLFGGGPLSKDAIAMQLTFTDPKQCATVIVSLSEEMPLIESLELANHLEKLLPGNRPALIANRIFPKTDEPNLNDINPDQWESPFAKNAKDFLVKKHQLDQFNLSLWDGLPFTQLPYVDPTRGTEEVANQLSTYVGDKIE